MFTYTLSPDQQTISLEANLTLEHAKEIHAALQQALARTRTLRIDMSKSTKADLSFLQILFALLRSSEWTIRFTGALPAHVVELATGVGAGNLIKDIQNRTEEHS